MKAVHAITPEAKPNGAKLIRKKTTQGWKIIFPILAFFLCLSCNKDDDEDAPPVITPPVSFLKATIDGAEYNFNQIVVETETVTGPEGYVDLHVIAKINGDDSKQIDFNVEQDVAGSETTYYFALTNGDEYFESDLPNAAFPVNLSVNANKHIVGTFSGTLTNDTETTTITNGSFDISY